MEAQEFQETVFLLLAFLICLSRVTWWNNQEETPIAKKLDRILINDKWLLQFPFSYGHFGEPDFSDHSPACIAIGDRVALKKQFMISHFLLEHSDFIPRVKKFWEETIIQGTVMFSLSKKLKLLKPVIKDINRRHFSGLGNRVKEAHSSLLECQQNLLSNPSIAMAAREKHAHKTWLELALAEEKFLHQRSRVQSVECGDCNTAYFHRKVASRRAGNQIHYLLDNTDQRLDDLEEVKAHCVDYFSDLFGVASTTLTDSDKAKISLFIKYRCSDSIKRELMSVVTHEDVKNEVFALPTNKTPGPDGYTGEFLRKTWDIVGEDFTRAVLEFFEPGQILKQWNCTVISLIPKRMVDFRPISLCNVVYKITSKILARRLQAITPYMISNSQSAFVKGRLLVENVVLATEMVQGFGKSDVSKRGLLKVDLRKAFDSISWDFIIQIFKAADFPPVFTNWIAQCITTTSNVNGELCGYFKGARGLRQGDPLSPSLFVMAMEVYTNLINSSFEEGCIGYHPLGRNPKITFADDIVILFDGKATGIASSLSLFQRISGQKTHLFTAGLNPEEVESLNIFGSLPIRYLGLPLLHRKLKRADYSPLTDKIMAQYN